MRKKQVPKKTFPPTPGSIKKDIGDLSEAVVWGVDPRIREMFVTSDGIAKESHRVSRTSPVEYYQPAGFKKNGQYLQTHQHSKLALLLDSRMLQYISSPTSRNATAPVKHMKMNISFRKSALFVIQEQQNIPRMLLLMISIPFWSARRAKLTGTGTTWSH
ncbi:hypothetical protein K501DRAFT_275323 [Backusella circina FSU 941]|nr:hypothetical protein K501DRAFT_275323 [Backusella circina FSU 941]